jgi:hypothetical protein
MYKIGDLLPCRDLDDEESVLVLDEFEVCTIADRAGLSDCKGYTGAIVYVGEGDYDAIWLTEYSRPFDHSAMYRKVL